MFSSGASNSSKGSGSEDNRGPSRLKNVGGPDGDDDRNDFEETHKIQAGIFSVLYILSKEKMNENLKFTVIKLCFDFTQLLALVVNPAHGWKIDSDSVYWQVVTFSRWNYIVENFLGYNGYVAVLYIITGMLCTALGLCVWIAYSYKNRSFAYTWPIHVLRIYATIHFGLFDIATLTLIQVSYDCQFLGSGSSVRGRLFTFPDMVCYKTPHLIPFVIGLTTQVLFVLAAMIFFTGEFEVNPISRRFTCCAHSHVEVRAFLLKVAMTVVYVVIGWLQVQTAIQTFLCLALTWIFFKNMPYMFGIINHIRVGSYLAVSWAAVLAIAILFKPTSKGPEAVSAYESTITSVMLYGLAPMALLGFTASYVRLNTWGIFVRKRFKEAPPGSKVKDIYRFSDPVEVEIIARVARHWIDDEVLDLDRVKEAEAIIKAGLVLFPTRAFMIMLYSNFLWDVLDNPQAGYSQLQAAKKANPNYMERFAIYRREQEHLARTAQTKGNGESTLDLVSYVEFQRNFRLAMRAHREALIATRNFWQYLLQQHITFTHLSKSLNAIESSILKADKVYRTVLERYPYSTKIIKSYARFLEGVKNDPWRASKFYSEAEKLDAEREEEAAALELEGMDGDNDSRLLNKVDERVNAVIIINSRGQIQMANKLAYGMFGYQKGELEGKNVAMLMPMPFSQRHNGYIKRHITTGRETVMNRVTDLVALHKDRYVFPFRLAVSKVSGAGDDSLFMGVTMPIEPSPDVATVYILPGGSVAAVDQAFVDWFGFTVEDYLGHPVHTLAVEPTPFKRLVDEVTKHDQPNEEALCPVFIRQKQALIKHKYTDPVDVNLKLRAVGCGSETVYCVEMRRNQDPLELILTNRKGRIAFISSPLARVLGHTPRTLRKVDIGELMPQPFGALHAQWIRDAAETKAPPLSCRGSLTVILGATPKTQQAVRLAIKSTDESGEQQHVVKVQPSSLVQGLDERRLRLTVDASGTVVDVGKSPAALFGFKPLALMGRSLADCVDVLHSTSRAAALAAANGGNPNSEVANAAAQAETKKLLNLMLARSLERPGTSWRVGVMPPLDNIRSLGSIATALLAKQTRSAVMELDVKVDLGDVASARNVTINISLWRADLMTGVLEVDKEGTITIAQDHPFYPSGLLFGVANTSMLRQALGRYLQLGSRTVESLYHHEGRSGKKGALKSSSSAPKRVGPLRSLNGFHSDGEPLAVTAQLVRKEGTNSRSYVVLHLKEPTRGSRDFLGHLQRGPVEPKEPEPALEAPPPMPQPAAVAAIKAAAAEEERALGSSRRHRSSNDMPTRRMNSPRVQIADVGPAEPLPLPALPSSRPPSAHTAPASAALGVRSDLLGLRETAGNTSSNSARGAATLPPALPLAVVEEEPPADDGGVYDAAGAPAVTARLPSNLPPPVPRTLTTPPLSQPRVATPSSARGRSPSPVLPTTSSGEAGTEPGGIVEEAVAVVAGPRTPHESPVVGGHKSPSTVTGLTLADYLVHRSEESNDDLAAIFEQAVEDLKVGATVDEPQGGGGSGTGSAQASPRVRAIAARPVGLSNLAINRKLAEQAAEALAASGGGPQDDILVTVDKGGIMAAAEPPPPEAAGTDLRTPDPTTDAPERVLSSAQSSRQRSTPLPSPGVAVAPPSPMVHAPPHASNSLPSTGNGMAGGAIQAQAFVHSNTAPGMLPARGSGNDLRKLETADSFGSAAIPRNKSVSFAPSQLMIDEMGRVERQPSVMRLSTQGLGSRTITPQVVDDLQAGGAQVGGTRQSAMLTGGDRAPPRGDPMEDVVGGGAAPFEGFPGAANIKNNIKLARIQEWVMTEGERYFRLEDIQDIGDTVYPFGPDLIMREDSRGEQLLVLNGGGNRDDHGEDDFDAAPSRWAEADGADMQELEMGEDDGQGGYNSVLLDSQPRPVNMDKYRGGEGRSGGGGDGGSGGGGGMDDGASVIDDDDNKSTMSAGNNNATNGTSVTADFRRGKRFRKLLKMLSTPTVQRATNAFRWQALLAIAVQLLANLTCFVLLTVLILRQTRQLSELDDAGKALVSCHDAVVSLQVMDNIYSNRSAAGEGLYSWQSIERLEGELKVALDTSWDSHNNIYLGSSKLRQLPRAYNLSTLWNDYNHQELLFYGPSTAQRSTSLWRLGNAFLRQGYELHHRHADLVATLGSLAASDQFRYISSNGLFELFFGYSQTLNSLVYEAVDNSNTINQLQLVLLVIEGCCICALVVAYMAWLLKKVDNQRYGMYGVFLIVPVGLVRGLASRTVSVEEENSDNEGEGGGEEAGEDYAGGIPHAPVHPQGGHGGDGGGGTGVRINLAGDGGAASPNRRNNSGAAMGGSGASGFRALYERVAFWRHGTVRHGKRTMLRNSKESLWLLAPFVVWGLVVVTMHSLGYAIMEQAAAPVAMTNVVNTVLVRMHRVVYFAQELAAAATPLDQAIMHPILEKEVAALKLEWDVMLYGANSSQAVDPHFSLAQQGVAFDGSPSGSILFDAGVECWMPNATDCYPPEHPYYAVVRRGLNAMVQRFFVESDLMLRDTASAWNLTSPRLDYIYHEGTGNMHWAMLELTRTHLDRVVKLYMEVEVFHVVVFVLSWLLALVFLFGMLRPFMGHTKRETERIAEMLSQLPADVDVEGLLNKALISIKADQGRMARNRVAPLSVSGHHQDDMDPRSPSAVGRPTYTKQA